VKKLSGNGAYTWWTRPVFLQAPTHMYFTTISDARLWRAFRNDSGDYVDLDTCPERDDHNAPSILARPNKDRLAFATRHAKSNVVNTFRASGGIDFHDAGNLWHPGTVTYTQVLDSNDRVAVFSRVNHLQWNFFLSENWGLTWGDSVEFLNSGVHTGLFYMTTAPSTTPGLYHFAAYGHPVNSSFRGLVYGTINVATGDISGPSGVVGNLDGTNLPLSVDDFDDVVPTTGTEVARMFDVGEAHGHPVVVYAKWDDDNNVPAGYWLAHRDGLGVWTHVDLGVLAGAEFWAPSRYYGGMSVAKDGSGRVFTAHEAAGVWTVDEHPLLADMTFGTPRVIATDSDYPLVRPYAVEDGDAVVWQRLIKYNHYTDYFIQYWTEGD